MVTWGHGLFGWCALAAVGAFACGGKSSSIGSDGGATSQGAAGTGGSVPANPDLVPPATVAELCETYPAAWGDLMARCYGGDARDWASRFARPCAETAQAEAEGRITLNEAATAECFAALAGGDCLFPPGQSGPACSGLVIGSVPAGEPCKPLGYGDECAPGARCDLNGPCAGTCEPLGVEGQTCHGMYVDVVCGPGLDCDGPSNMCRVPGAEGEPCAGDLCERHLYCATGEGGERTCKRLQTEGPCRSSGVCAPGFRCAMNGNGEGVCTRLKPIGAPCTFGERECAGFCSVEGTCLVVAEEGEPCGWGEPSACAEGLFCDRLSAEDARAVCRRKLPLGADWPETLQSGHPCEDTGKRTFADPEARVCAVCE